MTRRAPTEPAAARSSPALRHRAALSAVVLSAAALLAARGSAEEPAENPLPPPLAYLIPRIARHTDWIAEAAKCPAAAVPARGIAIGDRSESCTLPYGGCLDACEAGDASACYWLAIRIQEFAGDEK